MITCPVCTAQIDDSALACPVCGFRLKGTTQQFKPVSADMATIDEAAYVPTHVEYQPDKSIKLKVVRGPRTGVDLIIDQREYKVGRDPQCDIFLNDMTVSRLHATILPEGDRYKIIDNKSFNGVWINNRNISESILRNGDIIQIGAFCLQVIC